MRNVRSASAGPILTRIFFWRALAKAPTIAQRRGVSGGLAKGIAGLCFSFFWSAGTSVPLDRLGNNAPNVQLRRARSSLTEHSFTLAAWKGDSDPHAAFVPPLTFPSVRSPLPRGPDALPPAGGRERARPRHAPRSPESLLPAPRALSCVQRPSRSRSLVRRSVARVPIFRFPSVPTGAPAGSFLFLAPASRDRRARAHARAPRSFLAASIVSLPPPFFSSPLCSPLARRSACSPRRFAAVTARCSAPRRLQLALLLWRRLARGLARSLVARWAPLRRLVVARRLRRRRGRGRRRFRLVVSCVASSLVLWRTTTLQTGLTFLFVTWWSLSSSTASR